MNTILRGSGGYGEKESGKRGIWRGRESNPLPPIPKSGGIDPPKPINVYEGD
jgi:hypothetical protein